MDPYDPRLHPSHSLESAASSSHHHPHQDWDRRPPPPRSRHHHDEHDHYPHHHQRQAYSSDDRANRDYARERDHRDRDRDRRHYHHEHHHHRGNASQHPRSEYYQDAYGDHRHSDRYRDSRHALGADDRRHGSSRSCDHPTDRRAPHEQRDHGQQDALHHADHVHARESSRDGRCMDVPKPSTHSEPSIPSSAGAAKPDPLALPTIARDSTPSVTTAVAAGPPPLPSELHQLAEQGPMLHQAELAATHVLARQLPASLMPDLLQDVDEILDLLLPAVLQSQQAAAGLDQVVATLESRVKSQLKLPRFTAKHLKTLREHPILNRVLNPVIDGEVKRVAAGPRPT